MELKMLIWSIVLGLLHIGLTATLSTQQRGLAWNTGARDSTTPLTGVAARVDRALQNFKETFPLFAAAILALLFTQHANAETAMGAQLYFWARVAYIPVYAAGISYLRTLIWAVSIAGIVMMLMPLF
jgi:uncharacterized MAPEG superfamily protein